MVIIKRDNGCFNCNISTTCQDFASQLLKDENEYEVSNSKVWLI